MNKIDNSDRFDDFDGLTIFETLEELIGEYQALKLCREHGGRTVYIPYKAADDHWLVLAVGRRDADAITSYFCVRKSGSRLTLPMGESKKGVRQFSTVSRMTDEGYTAGRIAVTLRVHERTVYRLRKRITAARCKMLGVPVQRMLREGLSAEEIAAKLHIPLAGLKPVIAEVERRNAPVSSAVAR
ncbi:hypothetical protein IB024_04825 [Brucella sp. 6810]|uniref:helix-turn-helix domain-containing protein n=1 Tax=Brucella sp. 6810 TaxID=2769351 RepID=UPI00165BB10F|nr:helix-turn-helix domain-containing protein [Brucella sp. 6810]QNQ63073.1 hypothetical protein IB024_04825 [Brucella sp. 6810]